MIEIDNQPHNFFEMRPQLRHYLASDTPEQGGTGVGRDILRAHLFELNRRSLHADANAPDSAKVIDRNLNTLVTGGRLLDDLFTYEDTRDMEWMRQHETLKKKLVDASQKDDRDHMQRIGRRKKTTGIQLVALQRQLHVSKGVIEHCLDAAEYVELRNDHSFKELQAHIERYTDNPRIREDVERCEWQYQSTGYITARTEDAIQQCINIVGALNSEESHITEQNTKDERKSDEDRDPHFPRREVTECCLHDIIPAMRQLTGEMLHELEKLRDRPRNEPDGARRTRLRPETPSNLASNVIDLSERFTQRNR